MRAQTHTCTSAVRTRNPGRKTSRTRWIRSSRPRSFSSGRSLSTTPSSSRLVCDSRWSVVDDSSFGKIVTPKQSSWRTPSEIQNVLTKLLKQCWTRVTNSLFGTLLFCCTGLEQQHAEGWVHGSARIGSNGGVHRQGSFLPVSFRLLLDANANELPGVSVLDVLVITAVTVVAHVLTQNTPLPPWLKSQKKPAGHHLWTFEVVLFQPVGHARPLLWSFQAPFLPTNCVGRISRKRKFHIWPFWSLKMLQTVF